MESEKHGPAALTGNTGFAASVALLLLRLVLGWVFIYAGGMKLFGWFTDDGQPVVGKLAGLGLPVLPPMVWAYIASIAEFAGGILVLVGLLTRVATVPLLVTMFVAIAKVTGKMGFGGYQLNLAMIAMSAALLLTGPGLISADAFLFRRGMWARGAQPLAAPGKREA